MISGSVEKKQLSESAQPWKWQVRHAVTTLEELESVLELTDAERQGVRQSVAGGFPFSVTPYYLSLCDRGDPTCPIRKQCIPSAQEAIPAPGDLRDPLGEEVHEVTPGLIQRYPDRALLLVTDRCPTYCRFCTRSRLVGRGRGARPSSELKTALEYIRHNPRIKEVIVSGGEPFLLPTEHLADILTELNAIESVLYVRVSSRLLATLPQRVTAQLCQALRCHRACWLMAHFNHPRELTAQARAACALIADHGVPVMSQTVLLRGINDAATTLETLFRGLVSARVRPYYLLQTDPVCGTGHLRTPIDTGINLMAELQGRLSGIALPKFIVDTPGGKGKVPIGPDYVVHKGPRATTLRTYRGELVDYIHPPYDAESAPGNCASLIAPLALRPGDGLAVVAPSGSFDLAAFERGVARLRERYRVIVREDIFDKKGYFAGDDERRLHELHDALQDKEIKAIVAARGGYGSTRLLERLDLSLIAESKKLLVGFSDITALHAAWARAGVRSLHGSMVTALGDCEKRLWQRWVAAVEGVVPQPVTGLTAIAAGSARGPLTGGNLSVLTALIGTPFEPPLDGRVLFLEDVGERFYRIDRMLTTWIHSGRFAKVVAVALGAFEKAEPGPEGVTLESVLSDRLAGLGIPVVSGVPSGHIRDNLELPLGAEVSIDAAAGTLAFLQPAVDSL
jgi:lysine 2,3-aminomutase